MILDPSAPGATPMAVLCRDLTKTEQFNEKFLNVYKYEVLGGLHTLKAKHQLIEEYPENPFYQQAIAEIYVHLSDEQALRLAQCHNLNSHFVHKITHRDLVNQICLIFCTCFLQVEACRARLYRIAGKDMDSETPPVTAEWKESCKRAIIPKVYSYMFICIGIYTPCKLHILLVTTIIHVCSNISICMHKSKLLYSSMCIIIAYQYGGHKW